MIKQNAILLSSFVALIAATTVISCSSPKINPQSTATDADVQQTQQQNTSSPTAMESEDANPPGIMAETNPTTTSTTAPASEQNTAVKEIPTVHFASGSTDLSPGDTDLVQTQALEFLKSAQSQVTVTGACDERGSDAFNKKLGMQRAKAVKVILVQYGVPDASVVVKSIGKANPIAMGHDESAWAQNRRAEIQFTVKTKPLANR